MSKQALSQLTPVVELAFQAAQRNLAQHNARVRELEEQLSDLETARNNALNNRPAEDDAALVAGADVLWQTWIDQRRKDINMELARLASEKPLLMSQLRKAFGKKEALNGLVQEHLAAEKLQRSRMMP